ncbi:MAG: HlyD family secretion protein [Steroidobacteraceae bacterium]
MDPTNTSPGRDGRPEDSPASAALGAHTGSPGTPSQPASSPRQGRRTGFLIAGIVMLALIVVLVLFTWWYESHFLTTDDAFIDTRIVAVAPRVAGQVIAVPVTDNESVTAGEVVARIDPTPYQVALQQSLAAEQLAKTGLAQARANIVVAQAGLQQAQAAYASAEAQAANARENLKRYRFLHQRNAKAVARTQMDQVLTAARSMSAEARVALKRVSGASAQIRAAQAALAGAFARVASAHAAVRSARLNLSYTTVKAAQAGHVTKKSVAVGNYVGPGQELMAIVPQQLWVTANFKETDLDLIHPGQRVSINIDACPNAKARGHVVSIQRGSGEAFDLLPPQNATGNYVKIVQRVPVRIDFDALPPHCVLGPGMSVEPDIRLN